MLDIGIDPGTNTGYAEWNVMSKRLVTVCSVRIDEAMASVLHLHNAGVLRQVVFEDARLRTGWFGERSAAKQQGAGSVKRDCTIWAEFLGAHGIPYRSISPKQKGAKMDAALFARVAGWTGRTNEHGRDAAALVLGRK